MTEETGGNSSPRSALALAFHNMGMETDGAGADRSAPLRWSVASPADAARTARASRAESPKVQPVRRPRKADRT